MYRVRQRGCSRNCPLLISKYIGWMWYTELTDSYSMDAHEANIAGNSSTVTISVAFNR